MKVANKTLVKEMLTKGYILEFDFYAKCYICDSEYNRIYAVRFDTYTSLVIALEKFYRNERYSMTDSDYYRLPAYKKDSDSCDREYYRKEIIEMAEMADDSNDLRFISKTMSLYFNTKRRQGYVNGRVEQERAMQ